MTLKPKSYLFLLVGLACTAVVGCGPSENDHVPTTAEVQTADTNRQASIDKMNLTPEQKAAMKSHLGGAAGGARPAGG